MQLDSFNEIVEFALAREKEAVQFYLLGSQMINKPAIQKALLEMAEEEKKHVKILESLQLDEITEKQIENVPNLKISDYMVKEGDNHFRCRQCGILMPIHKPEDLKPEDLKNKPS